MHQTTSDRFGQTDYNLSENHDRPAFQKGANQYNLEGEQEEDEHQDAMRQKLQAEAGANGMFSFENEA